MMLRAGHGPKLEVDRAVPWVSYRVDMEKTKRYPRKIGRCGSLLGSKCCMWNVSGGIPHLLEMAAAPHFEEVPVHKRIC